MFRIYAEDTTVSHYGAGHTSQDVALHLLARHGITGATIYSALGVWRSATERALVIETDGASGDARDEVAARCAVYSFAYDLKSELNQTAVLVLESADTVTVI